MPHDITIDMTDVKRPTYVEVDLAIVRKNYHALKQFVGDNVKMLCVLKANAYGHGLITVAKLLQEEKAAYIGVAYLEEALLLRKNQIKLPILVMGGIVGDQLPHFIRHDITICASSIEKLTHINNCARSLGKKAIVHIKVDTGMERIGIHYYNAHKLLAFAQTCANCIIEGIFSHLANAEDTTHPLNNVQAARFNDVLYFYNKERLSTPPFVHFCNSAATFTSPHLHYSMVRVGLALFGILPAKNFHSPASVYPALSWKTKVVYFKVVKPGHSISYGSIWTADTLTRIVTLPVGYGDGYLRSSSNVAHVLINGKQYPVRGKICMDQMMIDIGWDSAYNGDDVVLLGVQDGLQITVHDLAEWADTIPYEILTNINTRVPRVYIDK